MSCTKWRPFWLWFCPALAHWFQGVRVLWKCNKNDRTIGHAQQCCQSDQFMPNYHTVCHDVDMRKCYKTRSCHGDHWLHIAYFRGHLMWIKPLCLLWKCHKTEMHFEWVHWYLSSPFQLKVEPSRLKAALWARHKLILWRLVSNNPCT